METEFPDIRPDESPPEAQETKINKIMQRGVAFPLDGTSFGNSKFPNATPYGQYIKVQSDYDDELLEQVVRRLKYAAAKSLQALMVPVENLKSIVFDDKPYIRPVGGGVEPTVSYIMHVEMPSAK